MAGINTGNYSIGMADIYFEATPRYYKLAWSHPSETAGVGASFREDASRNLGNIVTGEFAPDLTYLEHFITAKDGTQRKDQIITQRKAITIPFTFDEINVTNMKKYFTGIDVPSASLPATAVPAFRVMEKTLQRGSAQLRFRTDTGRDMVYMIPKCLIRPEGNVTFNDESWWEVPMVLEILFDNKWCASRLVGLGSPADPKWKKTASAPVASAPYGVVCMGAVS